MAFLRETEWYQHCSPTWQNWLILTDILTLQLPHLEQKNGEGAVLTYTVTQGVRMVH